MSFEITLSAVSDRLAILYLVLSFFNIAVRTFTGKPFHMNLFNLDICLLRRLTILHIRAARKNCDLIQAVFKDHGSKIRKFVYWPVCVGL